MNILVFGDSIVLGLWDETGGWVGKIAKLSIKKSLKSNLADYYEVHNLGIAGDTTKWLSERFEFEAKQRLGDTETAIIFAVGINDSQYCHPTKQMQVPPDKFRRNLEKLIDQAKKYSSKIAFIGLTPVDEAKVDPIPWSADFSYRNELVKQYDTIIKDVCRKNNVLYLEIFDDLTKSGFTEMLVDGVHPNSQGHNMIFKVVGRKLLNSFLSDSGRSREWK